MITRFDVHGAFHDIKFLRKIRNLQYFKKRPQTLSLKVLFTVTFIHLFTVICWKLRGQHCILGKVNSCMCGFCIFLHGAYQQTGTTKSKIKCIHPAFSCNIPASFIPWELEKHLYTLWIHKLSFNLYSTKKIVTCILQKYLFSSKQLCHWRIMVTVQILCTLLNLFHQY